MTTQFPSPQQPASIKLINYIGARLRRLGIDKPDLNVEVLIDRAQNKTGLNNFGDESFMVALEMLIRGLRDQARLSQIGQIAAYFNILDHLCVRLQLIDCRARRPEVTQQKIKQPLFILGLPRTGTTILFELMAQDPSLRSPASWEVTKPIPPATQDTYDTDKRIKAVDSDFAMINKLSPNFNAIHTIGAKLPQECVYMLSSHFISEQFGYMYDIPEYRAWSLNQDMTASYQWHAHFLQHLQVDFARDRWLLKTPSHLAYLKYLLAQYPDAAIVWTHRRPIDAIASFSSLVSTLRSAFSSSINPLAVGDHEYEHFSKIVRAGTEDRRALDEGQFFDVGFSDICADPISVVSNIYDFFGMNLSSETESRMREYLQRRPRDLHGEHKYSREDFGLNEAREDSLYSDYLSRFGDYLH